MLSIFKNKWGLLYLLSLIWGSSFFLMHIGLKKLTAIEVGAFRICCASLFIICYGYQSLTKIPRDKYKYIALSSLLGTFFPVFLFATSLNHINTSLSAIINGLTPISTLLVSMLLFKQPFVKQQFIGISLGFIGTFLLIHLGDKSNDKTSIFYAGLIIIATLCYAFSANIIKNYLSDIPPLSIVTANFVLIFIPSLIILLNTNFFELTFDPENLKSLGAIIILGVVATAFANILFFKLIAITSAVFSSSVTYLIPIVASIIGVSFLEEKLSFFQIIASCFIFLGIYLSSIRKSNPNHEY